MLLQLHTQTRCTLDAGSLLSDRVFRGSSEVRRIPHEKRFFCSVSGPFSAPNLGSMDFIHPQYHPAGRQHRPAGVASGPALLRPGVDEGHRGRGV